MKTVEAVCSGAEETEKLLEAVERADWLENFTVDYEQEASQLKPFVFLQDG